MKSGRGMRLLKSVYDMLLSCSPVPPESGGILGEKDGIVCAVCLDQANQVLTQAEYRPNVEYLNAVISGWERTGVDFAGLFHTHLSEQTSLSGSDRYYITQIMQALPSSTEKLFFPVVLPGIEVFSYMAFRKGGDILIREDIITIKKENL